MFTDFMKPLVMTVNFIFTPDLKKVRMIYKNRGPYPDTWNGVGGKWEESDRISDNIVENLRYSAWREISEETGVEMDIQRLYWVATEIFPPGHQPPWGDNRSIELWVFTGIMEESAPKQIEDEVQKWIPIEEIFDQRVANLTYAGDGNVPYHINISRRLLKWKVAR